MARTKTILSDHAKETNTTHPILLRVCGAARRWAGGECRHCLLKCIFLCLSSALGSSCAQKPIMVSTSTLFLEYLCPAAGMMASNLLFFSPFNDMRKAIDAGTLGDLNPLPWAFMLGNCCGWVLYSFLIQNFFVFFGNAPGFLLAIWLNLKAIPMQYENHQRRQLHSSILAALSEGDKSRRLSLVGIHAGEASDQADEEYYDRLLQQASKNTMTSRIAPQNNLLKSPSISQERLVLAIASVWLSIISILAFGQRQIDSNDRELIVGLAVNLNLVVFYGAPLSTIWIVTSTRSSASIHIPTMITATANGTFWGLYGFVVADPFIYAPNGLGALLGGIQMLLCFVYPRKTSPSKSGDKAHEQVTVDVEAIEPGRNVSVPTNGSSIPERGDSEAR